MKAAFWIDLVVLLLRTMIMTTTARLKMLQVLNLGDEKNTKWEEEESVKSKNRKDFHIQKSMKDSLLVVPVTHRHRMTIKLKIAAEQKMIFRSIISEM